jgi:hypothetical protein
LQVAVAETLKVLATRCTVVVDKVVVDKDLTTILASPITQNVMVNNILAAAVAEVETTQAVVETVVLESLL